MNTKSKFSLVNSGYQLSKKLGWKR